MTEIERKALAWVNEVLDERDVPRVPGIQRRTNSYHEALCRAIERIENLEATERDYAKRLMELQVEHEAFRREVSDAVEKLLEWPSIRSQGIIVDSVIRFIIPKPDPLVEALNEIFGKPMPRCEAATERKADDLRTALAARGLEIREVKP